MEVKELRYQSYLDKYQNCPMEDCREKKIEAFRWVHSNVYYYDFIPNMADHPKYPGRALDETDLTCEHFAVSMHKDLKSSMDSYLHQYNSGSRKTEKSKQSFIDKKGDSIAILHLTEKHGISDEPNEEGHFSFFPYTTFDYSEIGNIIKVIPIFE